MDELVLEHVAVLVREKLAVAVPVNELVAVAEIDGGRVCDDVAVAVLEGLRRRFRESDGVGVRVGIGETDASYIQLKLNIRLSIAVTGSIDWIVTKTSVVATSIIQSASVKRSVSVHASELRTRL